MNTKLVLLVLFAIIAIVVNAHEGHDHDHAGHDHSHDHAGHDHSHGDDVVEEEEAPKSPSKVVDLDEKTFESHIAANEMTLVEFFAPWCGHCKALAPEYDAASILLDGIASLAKVDCTVHKELCSKYEVQGFPTVKLFRNDGSEPTDYDQARKADAIHKFIIKQKGPAFQTLTTKEEVEKVVKSSEFAIVAFIEENDKTSVEQFTILSQAYRMDYELFLCTSADAGKSYNVKSLPSMVLFRKFDDPQLVFDAPSFTAESLEEFLVENSVPLVGVIGPENYQKYVERGVPLLWIFIDLTKDTAVLDVAKEIAGDFKKSLTFVYLDGVKWADHAKSFGLNGETPGLVIEDRNNKKNYVYPQADVVSVVALKSYCQKFVDGSLAPTVKSEAIPEKNDGPVKIVVGKTFDSIVLDPTKDVLLEIYAPWCGHCKTLAPKYEKLGETFKNHPSVVIAKVDGTENDIPYEIRGFPTLVFFPANDKTNPLPYEGERNESAMAKFIREHASVKDTEKTEEKAEEKADEKSPPLKDEL